MFPSPQSYIFVFFLFFREDCVYAMNHLNGNMEHLEGGFIEERLQMGLFSLKNRPLQKSLSRENLILQWMETSCLSTQGD